MPNAGSSEEKIGSKYSQTPCTWQESSLHVAVDATDIVRNIQKEWL